MKLFKIILLLLTSTPFYSQELAVESKPLPLTKSFTTYKNKVFCLKSDGKIDIWDVNEMDKTNVIKKDKFNTIYLGTKHGAVFKLDPTDLKLTLYNNKSTLIDRGDYDIFFNSKNELFLMSGYGIHAIEKGKKWSKFDQSGTMVSLCNNVYSRKKQKNWEPKCTKFFFIMPDTIYKDKNGIIWMSKSYGEWRHEYHRFDIEQAAILKPKGDYMINPHYLFEDSFGTIYGTSGSMHFSQSGSISIIENNEVIKSINSTELTDKKGKILFKEGMMIGPSTYNKFNRKFYFSTSSGIYSADLVKNNFINFELIFNPTLNWQQEPLAIGYSMSYEKLDFIDIDQLLFLTSNNGLGLYSNKKIKWLN
ncbi:hypothetical protein [Aquimarina agarivorans]|uniref:hypothetical protein n=1 Tax=Aquimarina agarivorans TaxID=980584 RepID=UPI000248EC21|nr:hypothetical protein [Aquimarina agarivorans]